MVDSSGVPGCSAACSDSDTKCPAGGCCAAGLSCDLTKPGFCLPAPGTNTSAPTASRRITPFQNYLFTWIMLTVAVASGTRRATASVVGGGNINFGPSVSATSLAIVRAIPQLVLFVPSVVLGLIMVGIFVAV